MALRLTRARAVIQSADDSCDVSQQRESRLSLLADLNRRVTGVGEQLKLASRGDEHVLRLQTQPGIGLLTSLALVPHWLSSTAWSR
jgi:hypothetical protein